MINFFRLPAFALALGLILGLSACDKNSSSESATENVADSAGEFRILAGSELKDMAGIINEFGRSQNVNIVLEYSGTLDAIDRLKDPHNFDAVWLSSTKYLVMIPQLKSQLKSSEKTMFSPVILGVKPETMHKLGWESGKTGWADIMKASEEGKFHFAMTNPAGSNTGFVALLGLAAELSGKGDALEEKDIPVAQLKKFFAAQTMTAGSSGVLAEMVAANPQRVDGMINYESVIRSTAAQTGMQALIPKEGVITADYPLTLLAQSKKPELYNKLIAHLRSEAIQKRIASTTYRIPLAGSGKDEVINELPFPASLPVVDAILLGFLDSYSRPATSFFVLDVSGSMAGKRMASMKEAMQSLALGDGSTSGRFALLRAREHLYMLPFSSEPQPSREFILGEEREKNRAILSELSVAVNQLEPKGGTAIFSSIANVYPKAQKELRKEERSVSIVLLTDGQNTDGLRLEEFRQFIERQGSPKVPVFAILYGDAKQTEMEELATLTGGRVFDARKVKLTQVMRDIRNYQ